MSSISSSSSSDSVAGGIWHEESPECTPASSMCSITAPMNTSPAASAHRVDVDLDRAFQEPVDQHRVIGRGLGRRLHERLELVVVVHDLHRAAAQHVRRAAPPPGSRSARRSRGPRRSCGPRRAAARGSRARRRTSRELPAVLGQVDRVGRRARGSVKPSSSSMRASRSGVCPPSWAITPTGCSARHTASTSSGDSGSKYSRLEVS